MSTIALPAAAATANASTLSDALTAASISSSPSPQSEPKSLDGNPDESLEDGEIREEDENQIEEEEEEDDGRVKTVFDDANRFNVKVVFDQVL